MPGMRLFGRRCALATDDFLVVGITDAIVYFIWMGATPVIYASYLKDRSTCETSEILHLLDVFLPVLCLLFLFNWIVASLFVIFSIRGTISDPEPRRPVEKVVYLKLFISLLDIAWGILGTVILIRGGLCDIIGVVTLIKIATVFLWLATAVRVLMIVVFYDWKCSNCPKESVEKKYFTNPVRKGTFKRWNFRLSTVFLWCTTSTEARKQALETASELLALLSCDLDLVASDVIAGLLLYRKKCLLNWKSEKQTIEESPFISSTKDGPLEMFPPESIPPWMNLQLANRYLNLGLGIFGWPWFIYRNVACGCCLLFKSMTCCFPFRKRANNVWGDNCCGCHLAGLQGTTELPYEDLVHVSFVDKVFEVPFYVTYDHQTSAVVVTARGTMSMNDVLTDVAASFACMDDPGCPTGALCHGGMLNAAREIKNKLDTKGIIEKALKEYPQYHLVIAGHSLGGSIASILTLLYLNKYPDVRCFALAPAPTVSKVALPLTYQNVFTVIYGNDSVCYLNYENVKNMVVEMVKGLRDCKMPKYKVFMSSDSEKRPTENGHCNGETDKKDYGTNVISNGEIKNVPNDAEIERGLNPPVVTESVYVAGTILHIRPAENGYRLRIATADEYRPLSFRPKSITDHFPQFLQKCLAEIGKTPVLHSSFFNKPTKEVSAGDNST